MKLIVRLFDCDTDRALIRDEMVIMFNSVLSSIACMTGSEGPNGKISVSIADNALVHEGITWISTDELLS